MIESKIQRSIIQYLKFSGYMVLRMREVEPNGIPDLLCISFNHTLWIEVKQPTGRLSEAQKFIHKKLVALNQEVITVTSLDELKEYLNE